MIPCLWQPIFFRQDTVEYFQWRVRNLSYPASVYQFSIEGREIIIRTTNKKSLYVSTLARICHPCTRYYKRFRITDMDRFQLPLQIEAISHLHSNNTLVVRVCRHASHYVLDEQPHEYRITPRPLLLPHSCGMQYRKPPPVLEVERRAREERARMKMERPPRDGDVECNQQ